MQPEASALARELVRRLESLWRQGRRPDPDALLAASPGLPPLRAAEVLAADQWHRWQAGERVTAEDYLARHPAVADDPDAAAWLLYGEFLLRQERGEGPDPADYGVRFPHCAGRLAGLLHAHAGAAPEPTTAHDRPTTPGPGGPAATGWSAAAGDYPLLEELGRGGMGEVYLSRDPALGRPLALKVLRAGLQGNAELERRFLLEAHVTGSLQHPGIVPVHTLGRLPDGRAYFSMKVVRGRTLTSLLAQPAGRAALLDVFEKVCQAVAYAHSRGVVHRDLKPANVMVGAFGEVQVMDWGLAKVLTGRERERPAEVTPVPPTEIRPRAAAPGEALTGVVGTPGYMAPEQARGGEEVDERADVFGLGAILCEILTGQPPFPGRAGEAAARAARGDVSEALARLRGCGADADLIALACACLSPERDGRPANAGTVAGAAADYQAGVRERLRQAELGRAQAVVRAQAERHRRRLMLGLAAAVLLLAAGAAGWTRLRWDAQVGEAVGAVHAILEPARSRLDRAWQVQDLADLEAVRAEGVRAAVVARTGGAPAVVRQEAAAFRQEAAALLRRAQDNRALRDALLNAAAANEAGGYVKRGSALKSYGPRGDLKAQYADAFRGWCGLDLFQAPEAELLARLRQEPEVVRQEVIAALDAWVVLRKAGDRGARERLCRLADGLDASALRRQFREVLLGRPPRREVVVALLGSRPPWPGLGAMARGEDWRRLQELRRRTDPEAASVLTVLLLAQASQAMGDAAGAEALLRRAAARRPDEPALLGALGRLLEEGGPGRLGEAIGCYQAVRALRPAFGLALGLALGKAGRWAEAEQVLRDLHRRRPPANVFDWINLSRVIEMQGKWADAEALWRQAVERLPQNALARVNLGIMLRWRQKQAAAEAAYREALVLDPKHALAHFNLGNLLRELNKPDEALQAFRRAAACNPRLPDPHSATGALLCDVKRDYQGARDAFLRALAIDPDDAEAHRMLSVVHGNMGGSAEALAEARRAVELDPGDARAYAVLGTALTRLGRHEQAVDAYRHAVRLKPNDFYIHHSLGLSLRRAGRLEEAAGAYRESLRWNPNYPETHCNLAYVYRLQGRFAESLESYRRGHALGTRRAGWPYKSDEWVAWARRLAEMDQRWPAFRGGSYRPSNNRERLDLGEICSSKKAYKDAADLYADAFKADPTLAENLDNGDRYTAACAAALAGCGKDAHAALDDMQKARLRGQAMRWLRDDLSAWARRLDAGPPAAREAVRKAMRHWRGDDDLAGVREAAALGKLPPDERAAWQKLWADVDALSGQAAKHSRK
jgi:tetratricopeptide (TPR) repeat protein